MRLIKLFCFRQTTGVGATGTGPSAAPADNDVIGQVVTHIEEHIGLPIDTVLAIMIAALAGSVLAPLVIELIQL